MIKYYCCVVSLKLGNTKKKNTKKKSKTIKPMSETKGKTEYVFGRKVARINQPTNR